MKRLARFALPLLLAGLSLPAHAHLVQTGFGKFYDGVVHLGMTPSDLLIVVAIALLAGLRGGRASRLCVFALPIAWFVGGLIGARWPALGGIDWLTIVPFALTGALVALDARIRDAALQALAVAAGLIHGLVNGATMDPEGTGLLALAGAVCAVVFITLLLAAEVSRLPAGWPRVAVRALGSWITATGMLMFGWMLHAAR